jgi:hypothetical protein
MARLAVVAGFARLPAFTGTSEATGVGGTADFAAAGFMELSFFLAIIFKQFLEICPG